MGTTSFRKCPKCGISSSWTDFGPNNPYGRNITNQCFNCGFFLTNETHSLADSSSKKVSDSYNAGNDPIGIRNTGNSSPKKVADSYNTESPQLIFGTYKDSKLGITNMANEFVEGFNSNYSGSNLIVFAIAIIAGLIAIALVENTVPIILLLAVLCVLPWLRDMIRFIETFPVRRKIQELVTTNKSVEEILIYLRTCNNIDALKIISHRPEKVCYEAFRKYVIFEASKKIGIRAVTTNSLGFSNEQEVIGNTGACIVDIKQNDALPIDEIRGTYPAFISSEHRTQPANNGTKLVIFRCSNCNHEIRVPEEKVGTAGKCKYCGYKIIVPSHPDNFPSEMHMGDMVQSQKSECRWCGKPLEVATDNAQNNRLCSDCNHWADLDKHYEENYEIAQALKKTGSKSTRYVSVGAVLVACGFICYKLEEYPLCVAFLCIGGYLMYVGITGKWWIAIGFGGIGVVYSIGSKCPSCDQSIHFSKIPSKKGVTYICPHCGIRLVS